MKIIRKSYDEYWGYYWRVTARHAIPGIFEWDSRLVELVEKKCELRPGMRVLDLGCGGGDQAKVFAKKGYEVVGLDLSGRLIEYARASLRDEGLPATFVVGDMRAIAYEEEFDLCVIFSGTFGFFSDDENKDLLRQIRRALKPGGFAFIDYCATESMYRSGLERTWIPIENGYALSEAWFDTPSSTYRTTVKHILMDGTVMVPADEPGYHANEIIRCYTAHEIESVVVEVGFAIKNHLSKRNMDEPNYVPTPGEPRGMIVLERAAD